MITPPEKTSKGITPSQGSHIDDAEKKEKRKLKETNLHYYWDEDEMLYLYQKLLSGEASKQDERKFWETVVVLVEKVYMSYPSIQSFYMSYDDPLEEIQDAQLRIIQEIHRALFVTELFSKKKGKLYSFVTVIARRWYTFYLNNRYGEVKDIQYINDTDSDYLMQKKHEQEMIEVRDKQEVADRLEELKNKLLSAYKTLPEHYIVEMLFDLLDDDESEKYVKYQRNIFNFLHRRKPKRKNNYFKEATLYFARHLKNNLSDGFKNRHNLETTEDCMKMSRKIFRRLGMFYADKNKN